MNECLLINAFPWAPGIDVGGSGRSDLLRVCLVRTCPYAETKGMWVLGTDWCTECEVRNDWFSFSNRIGCAKRGNAAQLAGRRYTGRKAGKTERKIRLNRRGESHAVEDEDVGVSRPPPR